MCNLLQRKQWSEIGDENGVSTLRSTRCSVLVHLVGKQICKACQLNVRPTFQKNNNEIQVCEVDNTDSDEVDGNVDEEIEEDDADIELMNGDHDDIVNILNKVFFSTPGSMKYLLQLQASNLVEDPKG